MKKSLIYLLGILNIIFVIILIFNIQGGWVTTISFFGSMFLASLLIFSVYRYKTGRSGYWIVITGVVIVFSLAIYLALFT